MESHPMTAPTRSGNKKTVVARVPRKTDVSQSEVFRKSDDKTSRKRSRPQSREIIFQSTNFGEDSGEPMHLSFAEVFSVSRRQAFDENDNLENEF